MREKLCIGVILFTAAFFELSGLCEARYCAPKGGDGDVIAGVGNQSGGSAGTNVDMDADTRKVVEQSIIPQAGMPTEAAKTKVEPDAKAKQEAEAQQKAIDDAVAKAVAKALAKKKAEEVSETKPPEPEETKPPEPEPPETAGKTGAETVPESPPEVGDWDPERIKKQHNATDAIRGAGGDVWIEKDGEWKRVQYGQAGQDDIMQRFADRSQRRRQEVGDRVERDYDRSFYDHHLGGRGSSRDKLLRQKVDKGYGEMEEGVEQKEEKEEKDKTVARTTPSKGRSQKPVEPEPTGKGESGASPDTQKQPEAKVPFKGAISGTWSGTCQGDDLAQGGPTSGTFKMTISPDGTVTGSFGGEYSGEISGSVNVDGKIHAGGGRAAELTWNGTIRQSGSSLSGSGSWSGDSVWAGYCKGTWQGK